MTRTMARVGRTTGAAVLALGLVAGVGCGKVAEKATERAVERVDGVDDVDISEDGVRIETEDGVVDFSGDGTLPDGWPDDVPVPDDITVNFSGSTGSGSDRSFTVMGTTGLSAAEVLDLYKDRLSGWDVEGESTFSGSGATSASATFLDGDRSVVVGASEAGDGTSVTINYTVIDSD